MPLNQKQFERLECIHRLLAQGQRLTRQELQRACLDQLGLPQLPSDRTIKYDFRRLRDDFGAPLVYRDKVYYYSEAYSLHHVMSKDDARFVRETNALLSQFAALPQLQGLERIQLEIRERAGQKSGTAENLVQFDQGQGYAGLDKLGPLYEALKARRCLLITYRDFAGEITEHTVSPYVLREYNNRWYLFGWQHTAQKLYNLALDRIQKIEDSIFPYLPDRRDVARHLADMVGVTRQNDDAQPEEILLKVAKPRASYLTTKPLHRYQERVAGQETADALVFRYRLIVNSELIATILTLGPDAEVLQPASLRDRLRATIARMGACYSVA